MVKPTATTFGLLGLLATRSWTGYELTHQVRRSLRFVWPASEGHLYREQKRLVKLGWASVENETVGLRTRKRYSITDEGRAALSKWLATDPEEPHFQIEGVLRTFLADHGTPEQLAASMRATAEMTRSMLEEMLGYVAEYLEPGGPMEMLERGIGGDGEERVVFHGRPMFPERLHVVAVAIDLTTTLLATLEDFFADTADRVSSWPTTTDPSITPHTRQRLEHIINRHVPASRSSTKDGLESGPTLR